MGLGHGVRAFVPNERSLGTNALTPRPITRRKENDYLQCESYRKNVWWRYGF